MVMHLCIMGVWALRLAPLTGCCAVMCFSRRCSGRQASAIMGLNLEAILHARGRMVRGNLRLGGKAGVMARSGRLLRVGEGLREGAPEPCPNEAEEEEQTKSPHRRGDRGQRRETASQYIASPPFSISCSLAFCSGVSTWLTSKR